MSSFSKAFKGGKRSRFSIFSKAGGAGGTGEVPGLEEAKRRLDEATARAAARTRAAPEAASEGHAAPRKESDKENGPSQVQAEGSGPGPGPGPGLKTRHRQPAAPAMPMQLPALTLQSQLSSVAFVSCVHYRRQPQAPNGGGSERAGDAQAEARARAAALRMQLFCPSKPPTSGHEGDCEAVLVWCASEAGDVEVRRAHDGLILCAFNAFDEQSWRRSHEGNTGTVGGAVAGGDRNRSQKQQYRSNESPYSISPHGSVTGTPSLSPSFGSDARPVSAAAASSSAQPSSSHATPLGRYAGGARSVHSNGRASGASGSSFGLGATNDRRSPGYSPGYSPDASNRSPDSRSFKGRLSTPVVSPVFSATPGTLPPSYAEASVLAATAITQGRNAADGEHWLNPKSHATLEAASQGHVSRVRRQLTAMCVVHGEVWLGDDRGTFHIFDGAPRLHVDDAAQAQQPGLVPLYMRRLARVKAHMDGAAIHTVTVTPSSASVTPALPMLAPKAGMPLHARKQQQRAWVWSAGSDHRVQIHEAWGHRALRGAAAAPAGLGESYSGAIHAGGGYHSPSHAQNGMLHADGRSPACGGQNHLRRGAKERVDVHAMLPVGRHVWGGAGSGAIFVWEALGAAVMARAKALGARCLHTLHGHAKAVLSLALVPASAAQLQAQHPPPRIVLSGSADGTVRVWSAPRAVSSNSGHLLHPPVCLRRLEVWQLHPGNTDPRQVAVSSLAVVMPIKAPEEYWNGGINAPGAEGEHQFEGEPRFVVLSEMRNRGACNRHHRPARRRSSCVSAWGVHNSLVHWAGVSRSGMDAGTHADVSGSGAHSEIPTDMCATTIISVPNVSQRSDGVNLDAASTWVFSASSGAGAGAGADDSRNSSSGIAATAMEHASTACIDVVRPFAITMSVSPVGHPHSQAQSQTQAQRTSRQEQEELARKAREARQELQQRPHKGDSDTSQTVQRRAQEKAEREAAEKAKHDAAEKAKRQAEEKAERVAAEKAKRGAEARSKREAYELERERARRAAETKSERKEKETESRRKAKRGSLASKLFSKAAPPTVAIAEAVEVDSDEDDELPMVVDARAEVPRGKWLRAAEKRASVRRLEDAADVVVGEVSGLERDVVAGARHVLHREKQSSSVEAKPGSKSATTPPRAPDGADGTRSTADTVPLRVPTPTSRAAASPRSFGISPGVGVGVGGDGSSSARQRAPSPKTQLAAAALLNGETGEPLARAIADAVRETAAVTGTDDGADVGGGSADAPDTPAMPAAATAATATALQARSAAPASPAHGSTSSASRRRRSSRRRGGNSGSGKPPWLEQDQQQEQKQKPRHSTSTTGTGTPKPKSTRRPTYAAALSPAGK